MCYEKILLLAFTLLSDWLLPYRCCTSFARSWSAIYQGKTAKIKRLVHEHPHDKRRKLSVSVTRVLRAEKGLPHRVCTYPSSCAI
ncbi:hypothetical protein F5890DRAFT_744243 [Lentinula detonsa]|uniref:Secreted protein n=1 Tax=Lentinula detonsa TaxID=2804962 RepID=A0AA38UQJ7_9AGAR|nr:hypothetical protein F5890DRAFT_744243 [Lentinula detonsa]